jgi:hypothetical protein
VKNILYVLSLIGLAVVLSACGGNDNHASSGNGSASTPPPSVQQPPAGLDFTAFVKQDLQGTSDRNDPLPINDLTFEFKDKKNPHAYDDVLGSGS